MSRSRRWMRGCAAIVLLGATGCAHERAVDPRPWIVGAAITAVTLAGVGIMIAGAVPRDAAAVPTTLGEIEYTPPVRP